MVNHTSSFKPLIWLAVPALVVGLLPGNGRAQVLRLGPFDFGAKTGVDAVYTTNVEQERPSEATAEREDFYLVWRLKLDSVSELSNRTKLTLDGGMAIEKHYNRKDLDNSGSPFGFADARFTTDLEPVFLFGGIGFMRTSESVDDKFIPVESGVSRKKRQIGTDTYGIVGVEWRSERVFAGSNYELRQERYDDEEFAIDETDEETFISFVQLKLTQLLGIGYSRELKDTMFINDPSRDDEEDTRIITLDFDQPIFERPQIRYSLGVQQEETKDDPDPGWELIHRLSISDKYEMTPVFRASWFIDYSYEQKPEGDEIPLLFGARVEHDLSRRTTHGVMASRQPAETLGSTEETDETNYRYTINSRDFLMSDMNFGFGVGYTISDPPVGQTEKTLDYLVELTRSVPLNARLTRKFSVSYSWEDSNLESEILDEFRVMLSYDYVF